MGKLLLKIFIYSSLVICILFTFYLDIYTKIKILSIYTKNIGLTTEDDIKILREFLNKKHLEYCEKKNFHHFKNDEDVKEKIKTGYLKKIINSQIFTVDSSVSYPYITFKSYYVLINIVNDFQMYFKSNGLLVLKPIITSALRTDSLQVEIRKINKNASLKSSHCYGVSVDIWYGWFDIDMNNLEKFIYIKFKRYFPEIDNEKIKKNFVEILKKYQKDGKIYVIYEREQPCFHITFLY